MLTIRYWSKKPGVIRGNWVWFSLDHLNPVIAAHVDAGGVAYVCCNDELQRIEGAQKTMICRAADMPISMGGAAKHNIANALAAAALTHNLDATLQDIRDGLTSMTQDSNPGRSNVYELNGFHVLVDFAHNPRAFQALFDMARALPAKRRVLCFGQAGDRTDELIRELARGAWAIGLDLVIISELAAYARGREPGEVYDLIRNELIRCGTNQDQILYFDEELQSLDAALAWAEEGDLVIMLALGGNQPILERLQHYAGDGLLEQS